MGQCISRPRNKSGAVARGVVPRSGRWPKALKRGRTKTTSPAANAAQVFDCVPILAGAPWGGRVRCSLLQRAATPPRLIKVAKVGVWGACRVRRRVSVAASPESIGEAQAMQGGVVAWRGRPGVIGRWWWLLGSCLLGCVGLLLCRQQQQQKQQQQQLQPEEQSASCRRRRHQHEFPLHSYMGQPWRRLGAFIGSGGLAASTD